jgi:hypothetical protein
MMLFGLFVAGKKVFAEHPSELFLEKMVLVFHYMKYLHLGFSRFSSQRM